MNVDLDSILLAYYIKYDSLQKICNESLYNISSNTLDVYVDIFDMIKPIYTTEYHTNKRFPFVTAILNIAAHIRNYFWSRHRIWAKIYLVYGDYTSSLNVFYPEMNSSSIRNTASYMRISSILNQELELVKILAAYINGIYFVKRNTNCGIFILDNIMKTKQPSIIISKDKYLYQIPALLENVVIFRPKKTNGEDISYFINRNNVLPHFYSKASQATLSDLSYINPALLSVLIALNGFPQYNMKSAVSINIAVSLLKDAIQNGRLLNNNNTDINYLYNQLYGVAKYIDMVSFSNRFNAIDILSQFRIYNSSIESKDLSWCLDLNDPNTVRDINNKFFSDNPIDLNAFY